MVVFHSIFNIWHGPPLSYFHGKEIDVGMNDEYYQYQNIMNSVGILNDSVAMNNILWDEQCFWRIFYGMIHLILIFFVFTQLFSLFIVI